ncbi:M48 family metallopeptidase [Blastopirellula marina]|uniref:Peptidase M48 domain-containing protein n=1 Tax=Blastopirellula marina TaxID=124 RepID=A0A2S8GUL0_9BACT|nr:M48 family metallopeptidase [Blastopirellula marina]PQO48109.1 hypothetical protein C5Y93_00050 [Blastopirellula marina]
MHQNITRYGFLASYIYPALALFLIPVVSLALFSLIESQRHASVSASFYAPAIRGGIYTSWFCILGGIGAFLFAGISVLGSLWSQRAQYYSLLLGWYGLRMFCTLEVIAQALLLFGVACMLPIVLPSGFAIKILVFVGVVCAGAAVAVVASVFQKMEHKFEINGIVLSRKRAPALWEDLEQLSAKLNTAPPDQVVAGIDDNFFVTQMPVIVRDGKNKPKMHTGRTLFVSLALLKKLRGREADAVLLHELAHFSGNDTLFSQKIAPLLARYDRYLEALHDGFVSRPIFYFAILFRALFEVSLGRQSREREFRADRLAAEQTSSQDMAHALLRVTAYSKYRHELEKEFFTAEEAHEQVNLSERIEEGFRAYASAFIDSGDVGQLITSHPFDSHPPLVSRLRALRYNARKSVVRAVLCDDSNGTWYPKIIDAAKLEQEQWSAYEEGFREFHQRELAYRYLPSTAKEQELVEKFFPACKLMLVDGKRIQLDFEKMMCDDWGRPLYFREVTEISLTESSILVKFERNGRKREEHLLFSKLEQEKQVLIASIEAFYVRATAAIAYQQSHAQQNT